MPKNEQATAVATPPDVELMMLMHLQAADRIEQLTRIVNPAGKPVLSKKAAAAILERTKKGDVWRSLSQVAEIPGVGPAAAQAMADYFAARVIDHDLALRRIGDELVKTLNGNPVLGKLMLVNPVRVLTEELGYALTPAMAEKLITAYAPSYRAIPARHDSFYDRLRQTGRGMHFFKRLEFHPQEAGPGKTNRPTAKRRRGNGVDVAGYDAVLQLTEGACLKLLKNLIKDIHKTRDSLEHAGQSHLLAYRAPRNLALRGGESPGLYFELPFSLDARTHNPLFELGRLMIGEFGVVLRPQATRVDDRLYVGAQAGILRRIVLHVRNEAGQPLTLPYDIDGSGEAARQEFNGLVLADAPAVYEATGQNPWRRFEELLEHKLASALGSANGVLVSADSDLDAPFVTSRIEDLDVRIEDAGGFTAAKIGLRMDVGGWGRVIHRALPAANIDGVPWFLDPAGGDFAAAVSGDLAAEVYAWAWDRGGDGATYPEGFPGFQLFWIKQLEVCDFRADCVELDFAVETISIWPWGMPGLSATITVRLVLDGQRVYLQWSGDDECWTDYFSNYYGALAQAVREAWINGVLEKAANALGLALGGLHVDEATGQFKADLLAAHGDIQRLQDAASAFIRNLAPRWPFPNSPLAYFSVRNLFLHTAAGELKAFGTVEAPAVSWPDDEDYSVTLSHGDWALGKGEAPTAADGGSIVITPARRQRLLAAANRVRNASPADRLAAASELNDQIAGFAGNENWQHIHVAARTRRLIHPLFVTWKFPCAHPDEILTATQDLRATVATDHLADDLDLRARVRVTDFFARTAHAEIDLGEPGGRPGGGIKDWIDYFGQIADKLRELGMLAPGQEGIFGPGIQPEVDPEIEQLLEENAAIQEMERRRG